MNAWSSASACHVPDCRPSITCVQAAIDWSHHSLHLMPVLCWQPHYDPGLAMGLELPPKGLWSIMQLPDWSGRDQV